MSFDEGGGEWTAPDGDGVLCCGICDCVLLLFIIISVTVINVIIVIIITLINIIIYYYYFSFLSLPSASLIPRAPSHDPRDVGGIERNSR
jgi:hypothetical protein